MLRLSGGWARRRHLRFISYTFISICVKLAIGLAPNMFVEMKPKGQGWMEGPGWCVLPSVQQLLLVCPFFKVIISAVN